MKWAGRTEKDLVGYAKERGLRLHHCDCPNCAGGFPQTRESHFMNAEARRKLWRPAMGH